MNNSQDTRVLQVPIEDIIPNRFQPRLNFDDKSLEDLSNSIKQHGIIQPLVLRRVGDKYEIIAGERRYKAATLAGLVAVPAIISDLDDNTSAEVAIVENVQRKDLTAIEEAKSFKALLDKGYMTQEELAKKMGLSQAAVSNKLRLLTLDEGVQQAILQEKISERHARSLLKLKNVDTQKEMLNRIINERLTVRQLEEEIKKLMGSDIVEEDVPKIETPNIDNILSNAEDIVKKSVPKEPEEFFDTPVSSNDFFSNPEKMPNKFFNFLEDEAANMTMEEQPVVFNTQPPVVENKELLNKTDDIEMLDDFIIPISNDDKGLTNDNYLNDIITTIRNLNLDSDKVKVEEINLPNEYQINIKIKKDN